MNVKESKRRDSLFSAGEKRSNDEKQPAIFSQSGLESKKGIEAAMAGSLFKF